MKKKGGSIVIASLYDRMLSALRSPAFDFGPLIHLVPFSHDTKRRPVALYAIGEAALSEAENIEREKYMI